MTTSANNLTPRNHHSRRKGLFNVRNDDGSLLLVILFTLMMTALILVVTGSMLAGLKKTRDTRDLAVARQAADVAMADVLIKANTGLLLTLDDEPDHTSGVVAAVGNTGVTWKWTAVQSDTDSRNWDVTINVKGKSTDREFKALLRGVEVEGGIHDPSTDQWHYVVAQTANYEFGFFGADSVNLSGTGTDTLAYPDIDGYNGVKGIVGSNGPLSLSYAQVSRVTEWNWTTDSGRCTSNLACGTATIDKIPQPAAFSAADIAARCGRGTRVSWTPASGPLVGEACYQNLTFDANFTQDLSGMTIYVKNNVTVNSGVTVNTTGNQADSSSRLKIAMNGTAFAQQPDSKIAMAVFAPNANCNMNAVSNTAGARTVWLGAATCKSLSVAGPARLRYDGGLAQTNDNTPTLGDGRAVWTIHEFETTG